ncbi:MAG: hypothetical protein JO170_22005 [Verrucomicrobia bacterium]|nr:hypothetical protein [Verrucomicrobiota bacterium]
MDQHQHTAPPIEKLKGIPAPVVALLQVLLEKDPGKRFQTPAQLQQAVARVREAVGSGTKLTPDELRPASDQAKHTSPKGKPGKRSVRWLVGSVLCLALIPTGWFFYTHHFGLSRQGATAPAPMDKSIAVLPFENITPNKDDAYFADGVQDEILNNLAKVAQLKVISRTSVMKYRASTERDLRQIANALGVVHVLEGTVRRDGNHVRVSTELVDARNDNMIWADSYDRDLTDIFAIQSEIAEAVASKLSARLSPEEQKDIGERPTTNLEAYELYLQAKELVRSEGYKADNLGKAIKLLEEATRKDPKFTLAYCVLARAHDDLYHYWMDKTPERRALAEAAANEALRLEPDSPEAHLAMAYHLYSSYRNYEGASAQIELAQRALPNSPEAFWLASRIDHRLGRWDQATKALEKAYSLDPRNPDIIYHLANDYEFRGRYREEEQMYARLNEVEPDNPVSKTGEAFADFLRTGDATSYRAALDSLPSPAKNLSWISSGRFFFEVYAREWTAAKQILNENEAEDLLIGGAVNVAIPRQCGGIWIAALQGMHPTTETGFGAARDQLAQRCETHPDDVQLLSVLAVIDAFLGRKQEAIEEATRAVELRPISQDALEGPWILQQLAVVYAWTSEPDLAFQELAKLVNVPAGLYNRAIFKADPIWDPIREDPRFDKLAAQLPNP